MMRFFADRAADIGLLVARVGLGIMFVALFLIGPGRYSLDRALFGRADGT